MSEERRVFVAVPIPEPARAEIAALVDEVRRDEPARPVRWVRLDGLHLTIRFLGPTAESRVPALIDAIDDVAGAATPATVRIGPATAFPGRGRPRTLVLTIDRGGEALGAIAAAVNDRLADGGWPREERPFRPHLTLARADGVAAGPATAEALRRVTSGLAIDATIDRLVLFESVTGGGPARYVPIAESALLGRT